jgi:tRNA pseudouridine38-40 synthase
MVAKRHFRKDSSKISSKKFKLLLEYDGTRYSGWQRQPDTRTIQGELYKAANNIFGKVRFDIQGAGRTDSGVHALCQVAHLEVDTELSARLIKLKFNDLLPHDINILDIENASRNFHARHDAKKRIYVYKISKRRNAFGKNHMWWIKDELNIPKMKNACDLFVGMNDFSSFADNDPEEKSTKVLIENVELVENDDLILIRISGSHFLWKMVRRIIGVLVEIGRGNLSNKDIEKFLTQKSEALKKLTAPPAGLYLEEVIY